MTTATATEAPAIECAGLTKVFRDFWLRARVQAVTDLDLRVERREVFGLLGPNGSGKSTTIKMILGLLFPTKGKLLVLGNRCNEVIVKRRIGYLPEDSYLYRFLNARELLDYYGRLFGLERKDRLKRIDMLLEMVGLGAVQWRPIGEYSKGMQRRIGLAQALINDPDLLILDEPTTGLDPIGTRQIKDLIRTLRDRGKTVLLCSHLLSEVEDVCDRVAILFGGKKRLEGRVEDVLTQGDRLVIQTPRLPDDAIERIRAVVQDTDDQADVDVSAPRQTLEQLFLEIVAQAQAEGAQTSGAGSGGPVAAFLAGEDPTPGDGPDNALLGDLVEQAHAPAPEAVEKKSEKPAEQTGADEDALQALVEQPATAPPPPPPPIDDEPPPDDDGDVDQGILDSLLDG